MAIFCSLFIPTKSVAAGASKTISIGNFSIKCTQKRKIVISPSGYLKMMIVSIKLMRIP